MSEDLKNVSYCVGMSLGESLMQQNLKGLSVEDLAQAISDTFEGKQLKFTPQEANQIIQGFLQAKSEEQYGANKEAGEKFLADNAKKDEVTVTASGLQYEVLSEGDGAKPSATNGTIFDSSVERGQPATFGLNQVIKGWTEGLQLMSKGAKYRFYIPQDLAYGATPHPGGPIEPYMTLVFDVELLDIA
jgi:FKBP-type peptidyl-prolyl cis-trans isomerase